MAAELIDVGGTRIFVDIQGAESAPLLLFIHGGPGQGCYDFMQAQGSRRARSLRVIGVDQRGALRSDPLPAEPALTMALLVSDYEDLRRQLGLTDWAILGPLIRRRHRPCLRQQSAAFREPGDLRLSLLGR